MRTLALEDFSDIPAGELPSDYTAMGEYHYVRPRGPTGRWYESTTRRSWVVVPDRGAHLMLMAHEWPAKDADLRLLVTGDPLWRDYRATLMLLPLRPEGFAGLAFRYVTGRSHYRFGIEGGSRLTLVRQNHDETATLGEARFRCSCEDSHVLCVSVSGDSIVAGADGRDYFHVRDATFGRGRVALAAGVQTFFGRLEVTCTDEEYAALANAREAELADLEDARRTYPQPVLRKRLDTRGFGTGRHLRFGRLTGRDRPEIVVAQNLKLAPGTDALTTVRALTALDLEGNVLWQSGEPSGDPDAAHVTCDVPVQVFDIDGDGLDEVLCLRNFRLEILDGRTGEVKRARGLPRNPARENQFGRLTGDAIVVADFRGAGRPSDILVKNRYHQVWALDCDLRDLWTHECPTGHFPAPWDFDGDGRDELFVGYTMLGPDGRPRWKLDWGDHTDEIAVGAFDPSREGVQIAIVSGDEGFAILSPEGDVLHRERLGHAQRVAAARFRKDLPGAQFYVTTFWGVRGIVSFHDCTGQKLFETEPTATGNVVSPVNWTGDGAMLALLSGSVEHGGMMDGFGRRVVTFPDDGHPDLCAEAVDLDGDGLDEILLWDPDSIWVYEAGEKPSGAASVPVRRRTYNASNYRGEAALPA